MNLVIVTPYISTSQNLKYYQSQQLNLAQQLNKFGLDVSIIAGKRLENLPSEDLIHGMKIKYLNVSRIVTEKRFNQVLLKGLWTELKRTNFDVVQSTEFHHLSTLLIALYCRIYKKKMIIYQGIYKDSDRFLIKLLTKIWDLFFSKLIISSSQYALCKTHSSATYLKAKGFKNVIILPVGVNIQLFNSVGLKRVNTMQGSLLGQNKLKLLMVGNLIQRKNYLNTIKALHLLKNQFNFDLLIIGKGNQEEKLLGLIESLGLKNNIQLLNQVPNESMKKFYLKSDFTLMFSRNEIFGMTILESMACGCPFISNFEPGPKDIIVDGFNGYKIDSSSVNSLALGLKNTFEKPLLNRSFIERDTIEKFSWETIASKYIHELKRYFP